MANISQYFTKDAAQSVASEIALANGNEVFFLGKTEPETRKVKEVTVLARGNNCSVPAIMARAECSDMVIHNHPGGDLTPSSADIDIFSILGTHGVGSCIVNNEATKCYTVVEPFSPKPRKPVDVKKAEEFFAPDGPLSQKLDGYEFRPQQTKMLDMVVGSFNDNTIAVVEAGTGTGKTFTYLYPSIIWALENRERCVVSTNTINLQEQLIEKDLPLMHKALGRDFKYALVKGRNNYACQRKLGQAAKHPELIPADGEDELAAIASWALQTQDGSRSDLSFVPGYDVWEQVQSDSDACPRAKCPFFNVCFYFRARRAVADADVLVVNHHLLFADLNIKEQIGMMSQASVLPPYRRVVIDEAHHTEEIATEFFSQTVSRFGIEKLLGKLQRTKKKSPSGFLPFLKDRLCLMRNPDPDILSRIEHALRERRSMGLQTKDIFSRIFDFLSLMENPDAKRRSFTSRLKNETLSKLLDEQAWEPELRAYTTRFNKFISFVETTLKDTAVKVPNMPDEIRNLILDTGSTLRRLKESVSVLEDFFFGRNEQQIKWAECGTVKRGFFVKLSASPLHTGEILASTLFKKFDSITMTSATLATEGNFSFFSKRSGLDMVVGRKIKTLSLPSPFDYSKQVMLGLPSDAPDITAGSDYELGISDMLAQIIDCTKGRTLVLFTAYRMLDRAHELLDARFAGSKIKILKQGSANRSQLLKKFRSNSSTVLLGTDSFWEGIDVAGRALECVVLVKLPFRVPTDPIIQARIEDMEKHGINSFKEFSLPMAVIKFKQGFGRLIRHKTDQGVIFILDKRIFMKYYGAAFLKSIPDCMQLNDKLANLTEKTRDFLSI